MSADWGRGSSVPLPKSAEVPPVAPEAEAAAAPPFAPWSVPAALFLALGIALAGASLPLWWAFLPLMFALPLWRYGLRLVAVLLLLVPAGYVRYDAWVSRSNPLESFVGQSLTLTGQSDGRYLTLETVKGVRVAVSPSGALGIGRVTVTGDLVLPAGKRNPGGFDYRGYLERRGIRAQLFVREVAAFEPSAPGVRERLRRGVVQGLDERAAGLMQAMTLGVRDGLGELREVFAASGLAHILALSGLHVGILMTALGFALRPLGRHRYPLMILFVIFFIALVGATPSVLRAGFMVMTVLLSLWLGAGRIETWPALALAALVTLVWQPAYLFDLSFQLSYLAVTGLLLFTAPIMRALFGETWYQLKAWQPQQWLIGSAVVSLSAQALTVPLVLNSFGTVPLFSPLVNVVAVPLAMLLVPLGFLAGVAGLVSPALAGLINLLTGIIAGRLMWLADVAAGWPSLPWGEISPLGFLFYALAMLVITLALWGYLRPWRALLIVAAAMTGSMMSATNSLVPEVIYLDVGQGDSALIRLPGNIEILVDGGGTPRGTFDVGARTVVPALRALGVTELELVIATHPDADHIEGLISVLDMMPVQELIIGVPKPGDALFDALMAAAWRNRVRVTEVVRGESLRIGNAQLDILNPPRYPFVEDNDNSVAFALNIDGVPKALFLGDISSEVEATIAFPQVEILMTAHHGSRTSTSEGLLMAAQPQRAVISYGRNNYGHPADAVVGRLQDYGVIIHETYKEGAIRLPLSP